MFNKNDILNALKPKYMMIIGALGAIFSYFVFSDSIIVKELTDTLGDDGTPLWGRDWLWTFILDVPGYLVLFLSISLILVALYKIQNMKKKPNSRYTQSFFATRKNDE